MTAAEWIAAYAEQLGVPAPSDEEIEQLLATAGVAAHSSERQAAPISCWIAAQAGVSSAEALAAANRLSASQSGE